MTAKAALHHLKSISEQFAPKALRLMLQNIANQTSDISGFGIPHISRKRTDAFICLISQSIDHHDGPKMLFAVADPSILYSLLHRFSLVRESLTKMPTDKDLPLSSETSIFIKQLMIDLYYELTGENVE